MKKIKKKIKYFLEVLFTLLPMPTKRLRKLQERIENDHYHAEKLVLYEEAIKLGRFVIMTHDGPIT